MVTVKYRGRFGNNLFQYIVARLFAHLNSTVLVSKWIHPEILRMVPQDNYLQEDIIYMLALSYKSISDFENAIKYYELSVKQFPRGSYAEEVLYNLILINKDVDINKARGYAEKLVKQFPHSQYNNTVVKKILG